MQNAERDVGRMSQVIHVVPGNEVRVSLLLTRHGDPLDLESSEKPIKYDNYFLHVKLDV